MASMRSILVLLTVVASSNAFSVDKIEYRKSTALKGATGGWGIGQSRDLTPEEFARGERGAFEGYEMVDGSDFMRQVKEEKESLMKNDLEELLGVARVAGINVKDPKERLNKFDEDDVFAEIDDNLDLRVTWDEDQEKN